MIIVTSFLFSKVFLYIPFRFYWVTNLITVAECHTVTKSNCWQLQNYASKQLKKKRQKQNFSHFSWSIKESLQIFITERTKREEIYWNFKTSVGFGLSTCAVKVLCLCCRSFWSWCNSLFLMTLWFLRRDVSCWALPSSSFSCFFGPVWHCDNLAWGAGRVLLYMLLVRLFIRPACSVFCLFSLPRGVRGWLRLMIVALPGLSFKFLSVNCLHLQGSVSPWRFLDFGSN